MDNELMKSLIGLGGIPVIMAMTQLIKPFVQDTRLYPIIGLVWGLMINITLAYALTPSLDRLTLIRAIMLGIMAGLSASGIYSATSTIKEGNMAVKTNRNNVPPSPPV